MMLHVLKKLFSRQHLTRTEAREAMNRLMQGEAKPEQVGAFLGALRGKGETIDEIVGCAESMRSNALTLVIKRQDLFDTCGTGGDGMDTFNISTANAFILAAAGVGIVKHGNRSVSSRCGSADVLEALGIAVELTPDQVSHCVDQFGFGFLFARSFHPAMKHVGGIRQSLGVRTVFNLLGPLTNPAKAKRQLIGVFQKEWIEPMAHVLKELGSEEVMLVHGEDGMDEITPTGLTYVAHLREGQVTTYTLKPEDFGIKRFSVEKIRGGDAAFNASMIEKVLNGEKGPCRDALLMNAAAALSVAGKVSDLLSGKKLAEDMIDSGQAWAVVEKLRGYKA